MSASGSGSSEILTTGIRIAVAGSVDSGKSTFTGVLSNSEFLDDGVKMVLDDGNGLMRNTVAKHKHEIDRGITSDISIKVCKVSSTTGITLVDLCGHDKYFKTTSRGIPGNFPDWAFLIVSANRGMLEMSQKHLLLLLQHGIPFIIIITRIDTTPKVKYENAKESIMRIILNYHKAKIRTDTIEFINDGETQYYLDKLDTHKDIPYEELRTDVDKINVYSQRIVENLRSITNCKQVIYPVVTVSNKTGFGLDIIFETLRNISYRQLWTVIKNDSDEIVGTYPLQDHKMAIQLKLRTEGIPLGKPEIIPGYIFYVNGHYKPPGIGNVIGGICRGQTMKIGDSAYLGPFGKEFVEVRIKSFHNENKQDVDELCDHESGCVAFALKNSQRHELEQDTIRRMLNGLVLVSSPDFINYVCCRFKAIIYVDGKSQSSITIYKGYSPVINMTTISHTSVIEKIYNVKHEEIECLTGDQIGIVDLKFSLFPLPVEKGNIFTFRCSTIHGVGVVIDRIPILEDSSEIIIPVKSGKSRRRRK